MLLERFGQLVATYHGCRLTRVRLHRQAGKYLIIMMRDDEERVHGLVLGRIDRDQAKSFARSCAEHLGTMESWPTDEEFDSAVRPLMQPVGVHE